MVGISGFSPILLPGPGGHGSGARNPVNQVEANSRTDPARDQSRNPAGLARDAQQQRPESDVRRIEATERSDQTAANTLRPENRPPDAARNQSSPFLAQFIAQEVLPREPTPRSNAPTARAASQLYEQTLAAADEDARSTFVGIDIVVEDEDADAAFFRDR